jgi:hypothetical protein
MESTTVAALDELAHELRNLVNLVTLGTKLQAEESREETAVDTADAAQLVATLIDRLIESARAERHPVANDTLDTAQVVEGVVRRARSNYGIDVRLGEVFSREIDGVDGMRVERVLADLCVLVFWQGGHRPVLAVPEHDTRGIAISIAPDESEGEARGAPSGVVQRQLFALVSRIAVSSNLEIRPLEGDALGYRVTKVGSLTQ